MTQYKIPSMIKTATGVRVDPLNPRKENVNLNDVLVALGRQIRYNGHVDYSVRDHTLVMYQIYKTMYRVPVEYLDQLPNEPVFGLMQTQDLIHNLMSLLILTHDMPEAYIGDMVQPLKQDMPEFKRVDDRILPIVMEAIIEKEIANIFRSEAGDRFTDMMREGDAEQWASEIMKLFKGEGPVDFTNYLTHTLTLLDRNICDHLEMPCLHGNLARFVRVLTMSGMDERQAYTEALRYQLENYAQSTKATLIDKISLVASTEMVDFVASRLTKPGRDKLAKVPEDLRFLHDFTLFDKTLNKHVIGLLDSLRISLTFREPMGATAQLDEGKSPVLVEKVFAPPPLQFKTSGDIVAEGLAELDARIAQGLATPLKPWSEVHAKLLDRLIERQLAQEQVEVKNQVRLDNECPLADRPFSVDFDVMFEIRGGQWVGPKNPWGNNPDEKVLLDPDGSGEHRPDGRAIGEFIYGVLDGDTKFPMGWAVSDLGVDVKQTSISLHMTIRAGNARMQKELVSQRIVKTFAYLREQLIQMGSQSQLTGSIYIAVRKSVPNLMRHDRVVRPDSYQAGFVCGKLVSECPRDLSFLQVPNWK